MEKESITIKDIAEKAQVSTGTVDRVLHQRSDVSEKTRSRVLKIIDELGYKTNIIAKTLASKKQIVFSSLIPDEDIHSTYWKKPLEGIQKAQNEYANYGVQLKSHFFSVHDKDTFVEQSHQILIEKPKGVILAPIFQKEALDFVHQLKLHSIPYVFLDSLLEADQESKGYVGHDSFQSGKVAARLIDNRIENTDNVLLINLAINPSNQNHLNQRTQGFRNYFGNKERIGSIIEVDINNLDDSFVKTKLDHVFKSVSEIKAVFVTSSKVHIVAKYLYEQKHVREVVLVGYDLISENRKMLKAGFIDYVICQNPEEQGYRSFEKLFQNVVLQQNTKKETFLPINIVIRENEMYN